jgi:4-alpha-glucanotransferase
VGAAEETAINGRWQAGPGLPFFETARRSLGELPLIAEDLGVITEDVRALRKAAGLPGMRVLQFAFDNPNEHLPHRLSSDTVVYTGTHDNNTASGWFSSLSQVQRTAVLDYLGGQTETIHWSLIRAAWTSVADTAIAPLQDVLGLGSSARLNTPGEGSNQWSWRLPGLPGPDLADKLRRLTSATERLPPGAPIKATE